MSKPSTKITLLFFVLLACLQVGMAQPKFNSPYSRIGIGDPFDQNFAHGRGLAGVTAAFRSANGINIVNPASYAYLQTTSFEVGVYGQYSSLESLGETEDVWSGNLGYLALAFPIKNPLNQVLDREKSPFSWGMSFSLVPYSNIGYLIDVEQAIPGSDTANYAFEGTGGTYRILWGNGFKYNNFSFGLNLGYLFGSLENSTTISFPNIQSSFTDLFRQELSINGFTWDAGVMYDYKFMKPQKDGSEEYTGRYISFGAYGRSATGFSSRERALQARSNLDLTIREVDTLSFVDDLKGSGKLPAQLGIGVITGKEHKWMAGVRFETTAWSQYENDAQSENTDLLNSWTLSIGGEITPDHISYNSYAKKMSYRLGAFYGTDPREDPRNEQLKRYGLTAGLGFPLFLPNRKLSYLNVAMEVGQFGTDNSLKELYARMTVGFSLNDNSWFIKRKFY
ncbi:MAG: hypothetical protein AAF990_16260 [Bacteroidota bacterium]